MDSNVDDLNVSSDDDNDFSDLPIHFIHFESTNLKQNTTTSKLVIVTSPILLNMEIIPIDQPVIPENFWKDKQKLKTCITTDKQVKDQSTTAKPDAQTSANKPQKGKKTSEPEVI
ncbi:unnamed protein product [Rhizophagus irregularis]|nr:unnamed protein product [Rhizophagus irregularis]